MCWGQYWVKSGFLECKDWGTKAGSPDKLKVYQMTNRAASGLCWPKGCRSGWSWKAWDFITLLRTAHCLKYISSLFLNFPFSIFGLWLTTGNWNCRWGRETLDKQEWLYMPSETTDLPCSLSDGSAWPPLAQPVSRDCFLHHFLLFWKDSLPGQPHLCGFDSRLAVCWCFQTESSHLFFPFQLFTNFMNSSYIFIVKTKSV